MIRSSIGRPFAGRLALVLAAGLAALPVAAGELNALGDGSQYNNADLTRDPTTGCENCQPYPPHEWDAPPFELDWSLALRGALVETSGGLSYEFVALPEATLTHRTLRGGYTIGASADIRYPLGGEPRIDSLSFSAAADHLFDAVTRATGSAVLSVSQDDPDGPGYPPNVLSAPLVIGGSAAATIERDLGFGSAALRGSIGRVVNGETVYDDLSTTDNAFQNTTSAAAGTRLGLRVTPTLTAFVDGEAAYEAYDDVSPSLLVRLDNLTWRGSAGLSGSWGEVLDAEASAGVAYRDFADPGLADVLAATYDASLAFRPDETVELVAGFSTEFGSPGGAAGATARLEYAATAAASYRVNPWLKLRASAGWTEAHLIGPGTVRRQFSAGTGLDYLLNENMDVTADYLFTRTESPPDPAEDEHRVTLGLTFHR